MHRPARSAGICPQPFARGHEAGQSPALRRCLSHVPTKPGRARLYWPMTSVPLGGTKVKVPAAKDGLRFQPVKVITVR